MKKVSVIVPVYNCAEYLEECFESIEKQTFSNNDIEVIIVNDGSTDNSSDVIEKYIDKHPDWLLINQENAGLSESRNNAMKISSGEFVTFLDSDDYLSVDAIESLFNAAKGGCDIVIGGMKNFNSTGVWQNYTEKFLRNQDNINYKDYIKLLEFVHAPGKLYRRSSLNDLKFIKQVKHEDNYFTLSLYLKDKKINMINNTVYFHRVREGNNKSIMQSLNIQSFKDLLTNYDKIQNENKLNFKLCKYFIIKVEKYRVKYLNKVEYKESGKISRNFKIKLLRNNGLNAFDKIRLKILNINVKIVLSIYHLFKNK